VKEGIEPFPLTFRLRPLRVDDAARVVSVEQTRVDRLGGWGYSYPDYLYLRDHARRFAGLAGHNSTMPPLIVAAPGAWSADRALS
jgi:hypothetical protein